MRLPVTLNPLLKLLPAVSPIKVDRTAYCILLYHLTLCYTRNKGHGHHAVFVSFPLYEYTSLYQTLEEHLT